MLNTTILQGRLTHDVELKMTQSGKSVARFSVAVERNAKAVDGSKVTDFIPCCAWGKTAEFVSQYFRKGDMLLLTGELQARDWKDKDGNKRTQYEVNASNVYFGSAKTEAKKQGEAFPEEERTAENTYGNPSARKKNNFNYEEINSDDALPF